MAEVAAWLAAQEAQAGALDDLRSFLVQDDASEELLSLLDPAAGVHGAAAAGASTSAAADAQQQQQQPWWGNVGTPLHSWATPSPLFAPEPIAAAQAVAARGGIDCWPMAPATATAGSGSPDSTRGPSAADARAPTKAVPRGRSGASATAAAAGPKRKRKPSEAQRQAHRRFRQKRKEEMAQLVADVAAKQAQLAALAAQHAALSAKARALEHLVASADDSMALLQQLEQLSLSDAPPAAAGSSSSGDSSTSSTSTSSGSVSQQAAGCTPPPLPRTDSITRLEAELQRAIAGTAPSTNPASAAAMAAAGAGTVLCSLDGLQEAGHAQLQQLQVSGLQRLMKSLAAELMGLLLQIGEQDQSSGGRLQQPGAASPALARLHTLTRDVNRAFRTFAVTNRIGMAALKSLNMDTGVLGLPPPPGHWAPVARLLAARLPLQVLSDVCVAKRLFEESRAELLQQRHQLLAQLQAQLADNEASGTDYTTDATLTRLDGLHGAGHGVLDSLELNLRKELNRQGVARWAFFRLMSPLLGAEVLVQSWPFMPDCFAILAELLAQPDVAAQLQQLEAGAQHAASAGGQQAAAAAPGDGEDDTWLPSVPLSSAVVV